MLSANNNAELLVQQALQFHVPHVVICNPDKFAQVKAALPGVQVHLGIDAACELVQAPEVNVVVAAMVGFSGLKPTLAAIRARKTLALANKETLVAAGSLVMGEAARCGACIYPVDSEHSAIFQCLLGAQGNPVRLIHLTASGGPFRTWPREQIATATKAQALKHPNWDMGAKITIDSATMMNKGFEVIEAKWLFQVPAGKIHVVVHPESVIHSMVEFVDGAVIAQLGTPDMRLPIQYALYYPERRPLPGPRLDFTALKEIAFDVPDNEVFKGLPLAIEAAKAGGTMPTVFNAANEAAVQKFLEKKAGFLDIYRMIEYAMEHHNVIPDPDLDEILETERETRELLESRC
jgi:1-deoxy-D-xylulose-5-phosphate reductoisomerase